MNVQTKRVCFNELRQKDEDEIETVDEGKQIDTSKDSSDDGETYCTDVVPAIEFTLLREAVLFILVLFYVADLILDIWVAVRFFIFHRPMNAWFVVFCILLPNLYAGYKSLQWYLRAHDQEPIRRPLPWMIRVIFFPVSLLLRYYDTWKFGRSAREARKCHDRKGERRLFSAFLIEAAEASMLRLFTIFLEDAPIAVLNLKEVILTPPEVQKHKMEMVLVVMFKLIFTMTLGVLHFVTSTKAVYHAAKSEQYSLMGSQWMQQKGYKERWDERGFLSLPAEMSIYMWHLCAIGSRLVAYAMFIAVYQSRLWILVGIRWILNTIWIKFDAWEISLTNCIAFGGVYLFSFVPTSPKPQLLRVLLYYSVTLFENVIIAALFGDAMRGNPYGAGAYSFVFFGAFLSMVFMCLYYGLFHPKKGHFNDLRVFGWCKDRRGRSSAAA